ncbi:MAG: hypothetical protein HC800_05605 [Phormidesmis sp. RL_2_1]|nr:hypothetical protein [Phormidesmis sp. RL_2_1]
MVACAYLYADYLSLLPLRLGQIARAQSIRAQNIRAQNIGGQLARFALAFDPTDAVGIASYW